MKVIPSVIVAVYSLVLGGCMSTVNIPENYQENLPESATLDVNRIGQYDSYSCATTSLAMVISYYDKNKVIRKQDVWDASKSSVYDVTQRCGNDMNGLERAAEAYGYTSYEFVNGLSIDELKYFVSNDTPVVVNIRNFFMESSHAVVVTGYDNENIYITDPARAGGGKYSVSYEKFLKHWYAYLCTPRRGKYKRSAFILYKNTNSGI
ncbi:C39 family peptidase [Vibrio sp. TH_r3]|uniref:C39 family peptidase n=1 Tax=Vibrio sp. TH_r3 TaxID=3082084 RepID=UPI002952A8EA|nr:C39 family peptidase [Vibrio sp. TH_r3]MDV7104595.1 C39 family peptidase [Vibrio sp. TH_r3]